MFFGAGAMISFISAASLLLPGSFLEPMWRLNPRAHQAFGSIGSAAIVLLGCVSLACGAAASGLWYGRLWGYRLSLGLLAVNLLGDIYNTVSGTEPRAAIGIPIVILILLWIGTAKTRAFFRRSADA